MKYTVVWKPATRGRLAGIWMEAIDRNLVTSAAAQIDNLLETGKEVGESRPDGRRILIELPLAVIFRINHDDRIVTVSAVWSISDHSDD